MYSKQYVSNLKSPHVLLHIIMNYQQLKHNASWCPLKVIISFSSDF